MAQKKRKSNTVRIGVIFGLGTFVALSLLVGGFIEFSREVGNLRWFLEVAAYTVMNKLVYKLIASFAVGVVAAFAADMIAYGKAIKQHKVQRVQFHQTEDKSSTRIA